MIRWQWAVAASRGEGACRTRSGSAGAALIRGDADVSTAIAGTIFPPRRASAEQTAAFSRCTNSWPAPTTASTGMKSPCWSLVLGLVLFAVVTAIMLVRARARWARLETSSRDEIAGAAQRSRPRQCAVAFRAAGDGGLAGRLRRAPHRRRSRHRWRCRAASRARLRQLGSKPARLSPWSRRSKTLRSRGEGFSHDADHAARPSDRSARPRHRRPRRAAPQRRQRRQARPGRALAARIETLAARSRLAARPDRERCRRRCGRATPWGN